MGQGVLVRVSKASSFANWFPNVDELNINFLIFSDLLAFSSTIFCLPIPRLPFPSSRPTPYSSLFASKKPPL